MAFDTRLASADQEQLRPRARWGQGRPGSPSVPWRQCRGALCRWRCPPPPGQHGGDSSVDFSHLGWGVGAGAGDHYPVLRG